MELHFKNFPASDLPYNTIETATSVMVKLYENIPFLTLLPNIGGEVSLLEMTIQGFLCISKKEHKVILSESEERLCKEFNVMDAAFKKRGEQETDTHSKISERACDEPDAKRIQDDIKEGDAKRKQRQPYEFSGSGDSAF